MKKCINLKSLIKVFITGLVVTGFTFLMQSCAPETEVKAKLSNTNLSVGEDFIFSDSTQNADFLLWEFGNGDTSDKNTGRYKYNQPGQYRIRVTVNGTKEKLFTVNVKENREQSLSRLMEIQAPETAMQGEFIVFKAVGNDKQWRWVFGESGMVDSREQNPIYSYSEPGIYHIELHTENTQYPIMHLIEIYPQYTEDDSSDAMSIKGEDIREKLQAIADGKPFNNNYNYIVNNYLCHNQKAEVVINNNKFNDFYSYCQGLRITGKGKLSIDVVIVDMPEGDNACIKKIMVMQSSKSQLAQMN